jgi:hypothetical protein
MLTKSFSFASRLRSFRLGHIPFSSVPNLKVNSAVVELRQIDLIPERQNEFITSSKKFFEADTFTLPLKLFGIPEAGCGINTANLVYVYTDLAERDAKRLEVLQKIQRKLCSFYL